MELDPLYIRMEDIQLQQNQSGRVGMGIEDEEAMCVEEMMIFLSKMVLDIQKDEWF